MTRTNWIRAAAAVTLLYAIGHSAGYPWTPVKGPRESALIEGMKSVGFLAGGANRTYWDFYLGFGVAISAYLALQAIVLWQVAGLAESDWAKVKPIVTSFVVAFVVNALIVWKFFFALPLILALAVAGCLAVAAFSR